MINIIKNNKKIFSIVIATLLTIIIIGGTSYAFFTYVRSGSTNNTLRAGKISFTFEDGNSNISLSNAFPISGAEGIALSSGSASTTFTITGNTSVGNSITYAVWAIPGDTSSQAVLGSNYANYTSKFRDSEIYTYITKDSGAVDFNALTDDTSGTSIDDLLDDFDGLPVPTNGKLLGYGNITGTGNNVTGTFTVKMWIDDSKVNICDEGCAYTSGEYSHKYYTMKISVTATDGEFTLSIGVNAAEYIISRLGQDGLVAVNTSGQLYDGTGTIREYRYSGGSPKNYIYFNNELWRIIGVFNGQLKIIKDTGISGVPTSYTNNSNRTWSNRLGTPNTYSDGTQLVYWNGTKYGTNYNDWTKAGLMYYLNEKANTNSYYYNLNSSYKSLIDSSTTYYLGNVDVITNDVTPSDVYNQERNIESTNLWEGNQGTWSGSSTLGGIGLLYPSDFGYAAETSTWTNSRTWLSGTTASNDWLYYVGCSYWTISPFESSTVDAKNALNWSDHLFHSNVGVSPWGVRPVLHLISDIQFNLSYGDGSYDYPYLIDLDQPIDTISYNSNGGSGTMTSQYVVYPGSAKLKINSFTRSGYIFGGWNTQANGSGTSYADGASLTVTGKITLYAQWLPAYTVTFAANGGSGTMSSQTFLPGIAQNLNSNQFKRNGYAFNGWNTQANGSGTSYANGASFTAIGNITLYAQWDEDSGGGCFGPRCEDF